MYWPEPEARWAAFGVFVLAAITDWADGHIARITRSISRFGRMLDPVADKLIVAAALVMLVADHTLSGLAVVPAIVILCREILVSGLREFLATIRVGMPVSSIAKFKTVLQLVAISALIAAPVLEETIPRAREIAEASLWVAAALTLYTGLAYLVLSARHFAHEDDEQHEPSSSHAGSSSRKPAE
ncbi:MAG TPA: CDP-diacylglycerol--glycerol-3-phosphate 3-phosphatidyltransferase, partial [Micropepsaceae bacterium]|nr:CDP-diacylglycerol--glycerol-3-phosphate 3-phosphatidyltransferase [Micropepsaceae bacterium]